MEKLEIYKGDSKAPTVTVTNADGTAFDLTGYTVKFTAKKNRADADADAAIGPLACTIGANPALGIITIPLTIALTNIAVGKYHYDVRIVSGTNKTTLGEGILNILQSITVTVA